MMIEADEAVRVPSDVRVVIRVPGEGGVQHAGRLLALDPEDYGRGVVLHPDGAAHGFTPSVDATQYGVPAYLLDVDLEGRTDWPAVAAGLLKQWHKAAAAARSWKERRVAEQRTEAAGLKRLEDESRDMAARAAARACPFDHPVAGFRCERTKGHKGPHQAAYTDEAYVPRRALWLDDGSAPKGRVPPVIGRCPPACGALHPERPGVKCSAFVEHEGHHRTVVDGWDSVYW